MTKTIVLLDTLFRGAGGGGLHILLLDRLDFRNFCLAHLSFGKRTLCLVAVEIGCIPHMQAEAIETPRNVDNFEVYRSKEMSKLRLFQRRHSGESSYGNFLQDAPACCI